MLFSETYPPYYIPVRSAEMYVRVTWIVFTNRKYPRYLSLRDMAAFVNNQVIDRAFLPRIQKKVKKMFFSLARTLILG